MFMERVPRSSPAVLVVEDEWLLRWALGQRLAASGFIVLEAGTAAEALSRFDAEPDGVSAVLVDLRLPDSTGMSVLRHVKSMRPACPVIMMTAHGTAENLVEAIEAGAVQYLVKPFDHGTMLTLLREAIRSPA